MSDRVLFVDDEELVLRGASRLLANTFEIETASGAEQGLRAVRENGPYAAVVSDLHMQGMSGAAFLQLVAECAPRTSRLVLTGSTDLPSLIESVNVGQIFRLLCKPCPVTVMREALLDAIDRFHQLCSESLRLEQALNGSVRMLSEVLGLVNPSAFDRASRICKLAIAVAERVGVENLREIEQTAMLSQLGCIAPGENAASRADDEAEHFSAADAHMQGRQAGAAARILSRNPLLLAHARILRLLQTGDDGGAPADGRQSDTMHLSAQILRVASDFDLHTMQGILPRVALARMAKRTGIYDQEILAALAQITQCAEALETISLNVADICTGMTIEQEVITKDGRPLIKLGTEVTDQLLTRLRMFANNVGVQEPILVSGSQSSLPARPHQTSRSIKNVPCLLDS